MHVSMSIYLYYKQDRICVCVCVCVSLCVCMCVYEYVYARLLFLCVQCFLTKYIHVSGSDIMETPQNKRSSCACYDWIKDEGRCVMQTCAMYAPIMIKSKWFDHTHTGTGARQSMLVIPTVDTAVSQVSASACKCQCTGSRANPAVLICSLCSNSS